jgi:hypothetical protein
VIVLILGAVTGLGLTVAAYGLRPPRPALHEQLATLNHRPQTTCSPAFPAAVGEPDGGFGARLGRFGIRPLRAVGLPTAALRADLAVTDTPADRYLAEKACGTAVGLAAPQLLHASPAFGTATPMWLSLALGALLFCIPDIAVRAEARRRREDLRHTTAVFIDLTSVALSGGAGLHQGLDDACSALSGWGAAQLRAALAGAAATRSTVWQELHALGERTDVAELVELAACTALVGTEGAKVRASLAAKSAALRDREQAAVEAGAESATERMALPTALMMAGYLVFLGFPALAQVSGAL